MCFAFSSFKAFKRDNMREHLILCVLLATVVCARSASVEVHGEKVTTNVPVSDEEVEKILDELEGTTITPELLEERCPAEYRKKRSYIFPSTYCVLLKEKARERRRKKLIKKLKEQRERNQERINHENKDS